MYDMVRSGLLIASHNAAVYKLNALRRPDRGELTQLNATRLRGLHVILTSLRP